VLLYMGAFSMPCRGRCGLYPSRPTRSASKTRMGLAGAPLDGRPAVNSNRHDLATR
jgi:hypothetical protein